ncbi:citrate transporter family protein [Klebsiella pneumoniae]|nr:citrate transporter family protein [Klebsiella pneumoniae]
MTLPFVQSLLRDRFLHLLLIIACVLSAIVPFVPASWPAAIDWHTIVTLSGLMLLTKGIELSGYFDVLGRKMARRFVTERQLAIFMVLAAALLSTFLTNDVALFIVVPLTLTLKKWCAIPVNRLIIFEALAVNAGSLLTPIGNPQNILLWGTIRPLFLRVYRSDAASGSGDDADPAGAVLVLFSGEAAQLPEQRQGAVMAT